MKKPDWKDAPEWANFLTMDSDGIWVWHEKEPHETINSVGIEGWEAETGKRAIAGFFNWKRSFEERKI